MSDSPITIPRRSFKRKISPIRAPIALFTVEPEFVKKGNVRRLFHFLKNRVFLKNTRNNQGKKLALVYLSGRPFSAAMCNMPGPAKPSRNAAIAVFQECGSNGSEWRENGNTGFVLGI
jgi:hypothetical protein